MTMETENSSRSNTRVYSNLMFKNILLSTDKKVICELISTRLRKYQFIENRV
jgi:hypothetical protein